MALDESAATARRHLQWVRRGELVALALEAVLAMSRLRYGQEYRIGPGIWNIYIYIYGHVYSVLAQGFSFRRPPQKGFGDTCYVLYIIFAIFLPVYMLRCILISEILISLVLYPKKYLYISTERYHRQYST